MNLPTAVASPMAPGTVAGSTDSQLLSALPLDILGEIVLHFESTRDTLNLSLASSSIHKSVKPYLYASIELLDIKTCFKVVEFLASRPDLCRCVRELVLRPSYLKVASKKRIASEDKLARAVETLAPNLCALEKFVWDGLEVPESFLWSSLRKNCPRLKSIGANLGRNKLDPENELFAFDDLISFSLTTEFHYDKYARNYETLGYSIRSEELPVAMWNMLTERSPRLQTLILGHRGATLHSQRVIDVLPVTKGRWSELQSLTIENAALYPFPDFGQRAPSLALFNEFTSAHPTLRHLNLQLQSYNDLDDFPENPSLISRGGGLPPASMLHHRSYNIRELALTSQAYCGFYLQRLFKLYIALLPNLQKLSLWIDLSKDNLLDTGAEYSHTPSLRDVLCRCHNLEDLTVMCSTKRKETFQIQEFTKVLEDMLPQLKRLEVWKCHKSGDDSPKTAAIKFAQTKPGLQKIVIRAIHSEWRTRRMQILQTGVYHIHHDSEGKPCSISVNERGGEWLASMLTHRYQQRIVPKKEVNQTSVREKWSRSLKRLSNISPDADSNFVRIWTRTQSSNCGISDR